jgi:hypothetical protein
MIVSESVSCHMVINLDCCVNQKRIAIAKKMPVIHTVVNNERRTVAISAELV